MPRLNKLVEKAPLSWGRNSGRQNVNVGPPTHRPAVRVYQVQVLRSSRKASRAPNRGFGFEKCRLTSLEAAASSIIAFAPSTSFPSIHLIVSHNCEDLALVYSPNHEYCKSTASYGTRSCGAMILLMVNCEQAKSFW